MRDYGDAARLHRDETHTRIWRTERALHGRRARGASRPLHGPTLSRKPEYLRSQPPAGEFALQFPDIVEIRFGAQMLRSPPHPAQTSSAGADLAASCLAEAPIEGCLRTAFLPAIGGLPGGEALTQTFRFCRTGTR